MIFLIIEFLFFVTLVLKNRGYIPLVLFIAIMWINEDVRLGAFTFLVYLYLFICIVMVSNRNINRIEKKNKKPLLYGLYYIMFSTLFFTIAADGNLLENLLFIKSTYVLWMLYFVLINNGYEQKMIKRTSTILSLSIVILCVYGIFTYISHSNPYIEYISNFMSNDNAISSAEAAMNDERVGLSGRITGTSRYTIQYAIMLCIYCFVLYNPLKRYISTTMFAAVFTLIIINVVLTGSRGPLAALLISFLYYFIRNTSIKRQTLFLSISVILFLCFDSFILKYIGPFFESDVGGSTVEGRDIQFLGALSIVSDNFHSLLFGKGPSYIPNYLDKNGPHPLALYFESTHIAGIVTYGILGLLFCFIGKIFILWKINKVYLSRSLINYRTYTIINSMLVSYFIYNVMVGNVYEHLFMLSYIFILTTNIRDNDISYHNSLRNLQYANYNQ